MFPEINPNPSADLSVVCVILLARKTRPSSVTNLPVACTFLLICYVQNMVKVCPWMTSPYMPLPS